MWNTPLHSDGRWALHEHAEHETYPEAIAAAQAVFCWPRTFVVALESGRTSWCQLLDAVRLGLEVGVAEVTDARVRRVVDDLIVGGQWREGDLDILMLSKLRAWPTSLTACPPRP